MGLICGCVLRGRIGPGTPGIGFQNIVSVGSGGVDVAVVATFDGTDDMGCENW